MQKRLEGQVALVTGAARGLGRAFALRLVRLGAAVGVVDANMHSYTEFPLEAIKEVPVDEEIRAMGGQVHAVEADVSNRDRITKAVDEIANALGPVSVVVCNAGGGSGKLNENFASTMDIGALDLVIKRNLYGTIHTVQAVAPYMKQQGYGKIITVSSIAGIAPLLEGGYAHYGASKAAIIMYTKYLARELGPYGITANCLAPGWIKTGKAARLFEASDLLNEIESQIALRRLGTPDDCANAIEFLATDLSSYMTGEVLSVSGGFGL